MEKMKSPSNPLAVILFFFIALFIYTQLAGPIPFTVSSTVTNKTDVFSTTGEGTITAEPDIAYVTVGVESTRSTVAQAQAEINTVGDAIVNELRSLGIDKDDVETTYYNINPQYSFAGDQRRVTGYTANNSITVTVRDITQINQVVDASTAAGATQVNNVRFDVEDAEKYENEAREEAVAEAREKAEIAAKAAGFKLGKVVNYSESTAGDYPVPFYGRAAVEDSAVQIEPATEIQPGTEEIKMTVTLSYEIL